MRWMPSSRRRVTTPRAAVRGVSMRPGTFERAWTIIVHLPDDVVKREELAETWQWPITDALAHLIHVDTYGPDVLDERPVLIIVGRE